MKKILLTGGSGFIGKNILESFLSDKYEIVAPSSSELNLIDTACVDNFFKDNKFDVVLHSGTKPGHRNAKDLNNLCYSNVRMFYNLERHKDKYTKFINFGSGALYDTSKDITDVKEEEIFNQFGENEHSFCKYVIAKQIEHLDSFVDLNIFGIFGKHEDY
jgi:GDP-L-fucose synthase